MSPIKTGFVGLSSKGWASLALGPTLMKSSNYSLVAVSTSSPESAKASSEAQSKFVGHPVKGYHGSTKDIANDPEIEFVAVSVQAPKHKEALLPIIEAGKDFFVEWPAGKSLEETTEIARLAKEKGLKTIIGLQGRQSPAVKKIKEIIGSGKIGKVVTSSIIGGFPREHAYWAPIVSESAIYANDPANGATFFDIIGGHHLDLFTYVLGDYVNITATTVNYYPVAQVIGADGKPTGQSVQAPYPDQITYSGVLKSGAFASSIWRSGYVSSPGRVSFIWTIDGEDGSIKVESESSSLHISDPKLYLNGELVDVPAAGLAGYLSAAWEEFAHGGTHATIEDAVRIHKLVDAVKLSAEEGRKVDL